MNPLRHSRLLATPILALFCTIWLLALGHGNPTSAQERGRSPSERAVFERVYVPAYSQVLTRDGGAQPLATTMAVHNVDPNMEIEIALVEYFDRSGKKVKSFLSEPISLGPFESRSFLVPIDEQVGGFGANFLLEWSTEKPAIPPAVESVMIGGSGTQGLSFSSTGIVIERRSR